MTLFGSPDDCFLLEPPTLLLFAAPGRNRTFPGQDGRGGWPADRECVRPFVAFEAPRPLPSGLPANCKDLFPPVVPAEQPVGAIILAEAIHVDLAAPKDLFTHAAECLTEPAKSGQTPSGMRLIYVADAISPEARKTQIAAVREFWLSLEFRNADAFDFAPLDPRDNVAQLKVAASGQ